MKKEKILSVLMTVIIVLSVIPAMGSVSVSTPDESVRVVVGFVEADTPTSEKDSLISEHGGSIVKRNEALNFAVVNVEDAEKFIEGISKEDCVRYVEKDVPVSAVKTVKRVVVGFEDETSIPVQDTLISEYDSSVLKRSEALNFVVVLVDAEDAERFISEVSKEAVVRYAEVDVPVHALESAMYVPNDPLYPSQWGPQNIKADLAWDIEQGSLGVKIAIVDTGIDYTHEDLGNYVSGGYDWVNSDTDPMDDNGHGTHCAGIAAAAMDNSIGIAGIAQASVMAEKVLDAYGSGYASDVAMGICDAADKGADVISLSLGGEPSFPDAT